MSIILPNINAPNYKENTYGKCALYCAKCGDFPHIKLLKDYIVMLKCLCSMPVMLKLSDFLKLTRPEECEEHQGLDNDRICLICKKKYCKRCIEQHISKYPMHTLIYFSSEKYKTYCQWNHSKSDHVNAAYYCNTCKIHLCDNCKQIHIIDKHNLINLAAYNVENKVIQLENDLMQKYTYITKSNKSIKDITIDLLKKEIQSIEIIYQETAAANYQLLEYCKFLIFNYSKFKDIPNFHILQSLNDLKLNDPASLIESSKAKPMLSRTLLKKNIILLNVINGPDKNEINNNLVGKKKYFIDNNVY